MSKDEFFNRLPDEPTAQATRELVAYCASQADLTAYWTDHKETALRVMCGSQEKVVLTVGYQTKNNVFLLQSHCLTMKIYSTGLPRDRSVKSIKGSHYLRSEVRLTPDDYVAYLAKILTASADSCRKHDGTA